MKTFIIMLFFISGSVTTINYQGNDIYDAYDYAESISNNCIVQVIPQ